MRVWRFQQISDEKNETIDGIDQSFNALQEEKKEKDNSQTKSETKKEQMSSQGSESEQNESSNSESQSEKESDDSKETADEGQENEKQSSPQNSSGDSKDKYKYFKNEHCKKLIDTCDSLQEELNQMEDSKNQQQESKINDDISNDSSKEGSSSNNNNNDSSNIGEEEQNSNGSHEQEIGSSDSLNTNQKNNSSNNFENKSNEVNKQDQLTDGKQSTENNNSDSLNQQNQDTQSQSSQNQSEQEPFQLSLGEDELSQELKEQLSEYMRLFSGKQGMTQQGNQQNGSQQSMVQNTGSQEEMSQTGSQQSSLQQGMNQSNGQQVKPQQNMNQSGSQQGDSQQSTESSQSGEKQENLSHGKETGKENSEVPCQDGEKTFGEDINQSNDKPNRSNISQSKSGDVESNELKEPDLDEQDARHNKPSNSTDSAADVEPGKDEQTQEAKSSEEITEQERKDIRDIFNNTSKLSLEEKRRLLNKVKKRAKASKKYRAKLTPGNKRYIKSLEEERIKENNSNNISDALGELPSFKERQRGDGYSIDPTKLEKVPNSVIKTLIDKFLNQRFCKKDTNLNIRSNSLEETDGFHKWKVKDVIVHLKSHQVTKVLTDKVGYTYADGKNENVPLSFYFDMSGSMSSYTSLLATIAIELLKKDVKVLVGYNERVHVQIEKIDKDILLEDLVSFLTQAGNSTSPTKRDKITYISVNRNIDNYLVEKKAERCVVFSDFDPISEVVNLSAKADVYWFCFEDDFDRYDLKYYKGFIYKVKNINDIAQGLIKVNSKRFESLCFTDNPASLRGKARKRQ